ncbi:MAG: Unknown protein [uncultured Sulfurovum sp.]|uniref:Paraquat-inducible protein A n=1 Tax=uncultured Sulfurovum sp. TaxID=269237 RepID=A0A6S6UGJ0_9BACT|nr:MAG: Unknown protein [uncultured Sulfurovum sp.]
MFNIKKIFSTILIFINIILLSFIIYSVFGLIQTGLTAKNYKADYATLHSVEYGMFNSDKWTSKVVHVMETKITSFNLNADNRDEIKGYVETIINTLILEAERVVKERNKRKHGFFEGLVGSTKQMITDTIIDFEDLRKRVPEFTDAVMGEVEKTENQERVKKLLQEKLREFIQNNVQITTDMTPFNSVLKKYNTDNLEDCTTILHEKINSTSKTMNIIMQLILLATLLIVIFVVIQGKLNSPNLFILFGTTIALLISGIMLPMLDIEAKISKLYFSILDQPIVFENQLLFFQSKSISDLVSLLLESGEAKMILVGVLLVMFSIIFPTLKLIATTIYYYSSGVLGNNAITRFFALRSTKWSMADVMVVSIFMAYLGLDGVVEKELESLENQTTPINIITTNGTHLEIGFFLFLGFVATSFVLSILVEKKGNKAVK